MLIDRYLPRFDVTEVHEVKVNAAEKFTFADLMRPELGWIVLDELVRPGVAIVMRRLPDQTTGSSQTAHARRPDSAVPKRIAHFRRK